jgi:glycosidase
MGNIMDSHDKVRFMAFADGEIPLNGEDASEIGWTDPPIVRHESSYKKLKLYLSYLLTIPGIPVIDYGDEIGMTGAADPDNRRMMRFGNQLSPWEKETLHDVRKIINIRDDNSALRYGDFQTFKADSNVYVYLRSDMNERILVALNKSDKAKTISISLPKIYHLTSGTDLYSGKRIKIKYDKIRITIPAIGFRIMKVE